MKTLNSTLGVFVLLLLTAAVGAFSSNAMAQVSIDQLQVQGFMQQSNGNPVTNSASTGCSISSPVNGPGYGMAFGVQKTVGGVTTTIWGTQACVTVTNGLFAQTLTGVGANLSGLPLPVPASMSVNWSAGGSNTSLNAALLAGATGELSVFVYAIDPINTLHPAWTVTITAVPTAMLAQEALSVINHSITFNSLATSNVYANLGGVAAEGLLVQANAASGQIDPSFLPGAGTLPTGNGGTGATSLTQNGVLIGEGTNPMSATAVGATNTVLHGNTGAAPTFSAVGLTSDVTGTLPVANGGTGLAAAGGGGTLFFSNAGTPAWGTPASLNLVSAPSDATLVTASALTTASALSSVGTITSGTWTGTTIAVANGGTGATTGAGALTALGAAGLTTNTFTGLQTLNAGAQLAAGQSVTSSVANGSLSVAETGTGTLTFGAGAGGTTAIENNPTTASTVNVSNVNGTINSTTNVGNASGTTAAPTVNIGANAGTGAGASAVNIGANTNTSTGGTTVKIGNGASTTATTAVTIGSTSDAANSVTINAGSTGGITLNGPVNFAGGEVNMTGLFVPPRVLQYLPTPNAATFTAVGFSAAATLTDASVAALNTQSATLVTFNTAAVLGACSGVISPSVGFLTAGQTLVFETVYETAAALTNNIFFAGLEKAGDTLPDTVACDTQATGGIGFGLTPSATDAIYFRYDQTGGDSKWMMVACNSTSAACTATATTIVPTVSTVFTLRIVATSTTATYFINGVQVGTVSADLPSTTTSLQAAVGIAVTTAAAQGAGIGRITVMGN